METVKVCYEHLTFYMQKQQHLNGARWNSGQVEIKRYLIYFSFSLRSLIYHLAKQFAK